MEGYGIMKWFHVYSIFRGREFLNVREGYNDNMHGVYINLYLSDEQADKLRHKYIKHDYIKRSPYLAKEHIMHEIYTVLPEIFEY